MAHKRKSNHGKKALPYKIEDAFKIADEIIKLIQTFDPPGVCARDLSESLIIQANHIGITDQNVMHIIKHHIKNLENKNYKAIAKDLKMSPSTSSVFGARG